MTAAYRERRLGARDGLSLYYRDYGDPLAAGVPLLCLAGLARNSKDFHPLASRVSGRRRVLCLDYRGRGQSDYDPDWRKYRHDVVLDDIFQLLAATNAHPVVICGVSYGGLMAMGLAVAAPSLLAGAILNDVGPDVDPAGSRRILTYIGQDRPQPDWDSAVAELRRALPTLSFPGADDWRRFTEATFRPGDDGLLHFDWDVQLVRPLLKPREVPDLWPPFGALRRLPVLAIRGGVSDVLSAATLQRMIAEKPDLAHVTVPGVGHVPSFEQPEVETAVDEFLARVDA